MIINPFSDNIVKKPRDIEAPVIGLNDSQLLRIENEFETLMSDDDKRLPHAVFITSSQAGYGKSHLLGRLFRKLNTKATLLYILPFQDPESYWKSILLRAVQELKFPDRVVETRTEKPGPTQLEIIAHGIIVDLTIKAIRNSKTDANPEKIVSILQSQSVEAMRESGQYNTVKKHIPKMASILCSLGIELNFSVVSWLNVLIILAYEPDNPLRQGCEDWLKGGSISREEAEKTGIRPSDLIKYDAHAVEMNDYCQKRLEDLCGLMRPVRPFVFFFDDTERYLSEPVAEKFALVIHMLVRDFYNHMTVVTANSDPWEKISVHWQEAQIHCLSRPVQLEGIKKDQGEKLIQNRLAFWGFGQDDLEKMLADCWLENLFQEGEQQGIRYFLQSSVKRWDEIHDGSTSMDLDTHYWRTVERIKSEKRRQVFDRDALRWLVEEAVVGLDGLGVSRYKGPKPYLEIQWKNDGKFLYFGFEDGNHWRRWKAIMQEAKRHFKGAEKAKSVFFRTRELKKIPPDSWKIAADLNRARTKFLRIVDLDFDTICRLYAARDIYNEAVSGDIPFTADKTLFYIQKQLADFWEMLWGEPKIEPVVEPAPPADPPPELIETIKKIVNREKFMAFSELLVRVEDTWPDESMIRAGVDGIEEIKQYHAPNMTVLKWL